MSAVNFAGFLRCEKNRTYKEKRSMFNHSMYLLTKYIWRKWDKEKLKMRKHKAVIGVEPAVDDCFV